MPPNYYPTLEEPQGTEEVQVRADRKERNERALQAWQNKETRRPEEETRLFKGSTRAEAEKRLMSKLFLSFGKMSKGFS